MLDTISLYQSGKNGSDFNINFKEFGSLVSKTGQINSYQNNFTLSDKDKRNIFIKCDLNNNYVLATFSIPKLLYGNSLNNIQVKDKDQVLNILTGRLKGILEADFQNWNVSRLDVAKNILLKDEVSKYITGLKKAYDVTQGRFQFSIIKDETLTISNNSRRFIIYDKVKEELSNKEISRSEAKEFGNILRLEIQHKKAKHIQTSFKRKYLFDELFSENVFNDFEKFQLSFFDKFYCNSGQYEMFIQDVALAELIFLEYSKRDIAKNFLVKKYLNNNELVTEDFRNMLRGYYKTSQALNKALRQINKLQSIGNETVLDVIDEIRHKLVA
jgi:hypothetical protein